MIFRTYRLVATIFAFALVQAIAHAQMPTFKVAVATAQTIEAPHTITLVGTVGAARVSRIAAEVGGIVEEMTIRQGDRVARGDVLCRLDAGALRWSLSEARAKADALRAVHEELVAGTRKEDLDMLRAALDEAQANVERWRFEVDRVEGLKSGSASNLKELTDARADYAVARERFNAAQAGYEKGVAGPRPYEITKAEYDLRAQEALVKRLERDLDKTVIHAPFGGAIVERFVELGEWVGAGDEVVELAELDTVLVRVDAPERAFPYVVVGDETRLIVDALDRSFVGRVKHVIPRAAEDARTIPVEIEVDNKDGALADGMFARAIVKAGPTRSIVAVPKDAIVERGATFYVATIQPGQGGALTGMLRPVTVGLGMEKWIEITSQNVPPGTPVVIRGTERMAPFPMPVEIVDEMGRPAELPSGGGTVGGGTQAQGHEKGSAGADREGG